MRTIKISLQFNKLFLDKVLLMPKINWNDMSDSDESSEQDQTTIDEQPRLSKKTESSPPNLTKLRLACDELSLKRLQSHEKDQVWLYVPNSFFQKSDQVHSLLNQQQNVKKLLRKTNIGWNVLVDYEIGKKLIQQGLGNNNIFVKFIYSNQNEEKTNGKEKYGKLQKKATYVEKNSRHSFEKQQSSPTSKYDRNINKDIYQQEKGQQKGEKKKTKWVQKVKPFSMQDLKEQKTKKYQELPSPKTLSNLDQIYSKNSQIAQESFKTFKSPKKYEQIRSPRKNQKNDFRSPRKYITKQVAQLKSQISVKQQNKDLQVQENTLENQKKESILTEISSAIQDDQGEDSQESIQKQQKKKKKKKNKKTKTTKSDKLDNNPFSFLVK